MSTSLSKLLSLFQKVSIGIGDKVLYASTFSIPKTPRSPGNYLCKADTLIGSIAVGWEVVKGECTGRVRLSLPNSEAHTWNESFLLLGGKYAFTIEVTRVSSIIFRVQLLVNFVAYGNPVYLNIWEVRKQLKVSLNAKGAVLLPNIAYMELTFTVSTLEAISGKVPLLKLNNVFDNLYKTTSTLALVLPKFTEQSPPITIGLVPHVKQGSPTYGATLETDICNQKRYGYTPYNKTVVVLKSGSEHTLKVYCLGPTLKGQHIKALTGLSAGAEVNFEIIPSNNPLGVLVTQLDESTPSTLEIYTTST